MVYIAVLGFGTVGSGVLEVLEKNAVRIAEKTKEEIKVKYILDIKDIDARYKHMQIKDFSVIENDPEVRVVVECIGGSTIAYDFVKRSLLSGKSVVTSNKELVAEYGRELVKLAGDNNLNFMFEASVGGGIPVIRPISECLAANEIDEITGILNGTTNYILTLMIKRGLSFEDALKNAADNGYSELNPADDVEGKDACRKICILAALAFGKHVYPKQVSAEGITRLELKDVETAGKMGYAVKLLGRAVRLDGGKICVYVAPHLVSAAHPLACVDDVFNGILIKGDATGDVMFYGRGAGSLPTASAVAADVMDCVKHLNACKYLSWEEGEDGYVSGSEVLSSKWYVRAKINETELCERFPEAEILTANGEVSFILPPVCGEPRKILDGIEVSAAIRVLD